MLDTLIAVDDAIDASAEIAEAIVKCSSIFSGGSDADGKGSPQGDQPTSSSRKPEWQGSATPNDRDKARSTLRQLYRDWSAEGAGERTISYGPVLTALEEEFASVPLQKKGDIHILIPGAGLGRLPFEVCRLGFSVEGNEISYHQLLTSSFILNHLAPGQQYELYPFALSFSNHATRAHQLRKVMIPDIHPGTALEEASAETDTHAFERMGMAAADFCVAYKESRNRDAYNAVLTVFFIDTAPNLIAYIETVWHCLQPGGVWINNGPLLWHFENNPPGKTSHREEESRPDNQSGSQPLGIAEAGSVELSGDEVLALLRHFGFVIEKHEYGERSTGYIQDPDSMMLHLYKPSFWIARKPSE